jgi:undecaprenyl diphosphate synthase
MPPKHIALLPDGNRRWAKKHRASRYEAHRHSLVEVLPEIVEACFELKIHTVTVQPFSTENWQRSKSEIDELMGINIEMIKKFSSISLRQSARIYHLGRQERLPPAVLKKLNAAKVESANYNKHVINLALDYSGVDDILRSVDRLIKEPNALKELKESGLENMLDTRGQKHPNPDFIIRTAEKRLSGFMAYQAAYAEIYFSSKLWPDFTRSDLLEALADFSGRQRRFGK